MVECAVSLWFGLKWASERSGNCIKNVFFTTWNLKANMTVVYLRQLSVSSPESTQALLEERVDLGLLYGGGQVHGLQRAGVLVAARPRERERDHRRLLPLRQEVQESEPHRSVLVGKQKWKKGGGGENMKHEDVVREKPEVIFTWLAEVLCEVLLVPNDWACLLVRSFLASTAA